MKAIIALGVGGLLAGCLGGRTATAPPPAGSQLVEFKAKDGTTVYADFYPAKARAKTVVLMFHQARSSAAEYYPIAPRVAAWGYDCLAVDLRSGGDMYGANRTAAQFSQDPGYMAAYQDMQAALAWVRSQSRYATIVVWGSSYSASLSLRLAGENPEVKALVLFSPGEYLDPKGVVAQWASAVKAPIFAGCTSDEVSDVTALLGSAPQRTLHTDSDMIHGSSALRPEKNPRGSHAVFSLVAGFLAKNAR